MEALLTIILLICYTAAFCTIVDIFVRRAVKYGIDYYFDKKSKQSNSDV